MDWGTTNLRAYWVNEDRQVVNTRVSDQGLSNPPNDFGQCLTNLIQPWLNEAPQTAIIISGMVGSPSGWVEVPHIPCPAGLSDLASAAYRLADFLHGNAWMIPGVKGTGIGGSPDVMRGEEVQFFGAQALLTEQGKPWPDIWCFPGTHNKWIRCGDRISGFSTSMVGEFYELARRHSLLSQSLSSTGNPSDDPTLFVKGLDASQQPGGLLHHLFSVRTLQLLGTHDPNQGHDYLSGILIGHDIQAQSMGADTHIGIIAAAALAHRYELALSHFGHPHSTVATDQATVRGATLIADHLAANTTQPNLGGTP